MRKSAIIDLGSNSVRMSIFEMHDDGSYKEVKNFRSMVKLSEGMTEDMRLQDTAMLRTINALMGYKSIILKENILSIAAVATAAVRKAVNGKAFLDDVRTSCGIDVEVIDGEKEAYYDYLAVKSAFPSDSGIICDIGGGSTELIGFNKTGVIGFVSIPMGSRSIYEMFLAEGETEESCFGAMEYIRNKFSDVTWLKELSGYEIAGIGGTLRALAKFDLSDFSSGKVPSHSMNSEKIDHLYTQIKNATLNERKSMAGISDRADIVLGGLMPLMVLKDVVSSPGMTALDVGVRDGIVIDLQMKK